MATREELIKTGEADELKAAHARLANWAGDRIAELELECQQSKELGFMLAVQTLEAEVARIVRAGQAEEHEEFIKGLASAAHFLRNRDHK